MHRVSAWKRFEDVTLNESADDQNGNALKKSHGEALSCLFYLDRLKDADIE